MIGALRTPEDQRWYRLSIGALVLSAWATLALWGASPFSGLLGHGESGKDDLSPLLRLAAFVFGWTLMTLAMMLPSSLPLFNLFRRFVLHRPDRTRLLLLLGAGYLSIWVAFGLLSYLGDGFLHAAITGAPALQTASGGIATAILLVAGVYQFTPLKTMCLTKCRSPYMFLVQHWHGRQAGRDALRLGIRHGLFCLGCCWTLMLLMFAAGAANLGWMLALAALMAAERTTRWGRRLTVPLGCVLVIWAGLHLAGVLLLPVG
jgi:predicted metal-binding membrane protein